MSERWEIDPGHSRLGFSAKHLMVTTVRGQFTDIDGYVEVPDGGEGGQVVVNARAASITTHSDQRDTDLRSGNFLDADKFPEITFRSTSVRRAGDELTVTGDLTIRGVTRPVTLDGQLEGTAKDPWGNQRAATTFTGKFDRKDFGLTWNMPLEGGGVLVSDQVKLEAEITLVQKVTAPAAS